MHTLYRRRILFGSIIANLLDIVQWFSQPQSHPPRKRFGGRTEGNFLQSPSRNPESRLRCRLQRCMIFAIPVLEEMNEFTAKPRDKTNAVSLSADIVSRRRVKNMQMTSEQETQAIPRRRTVATASVKLCYCYLEAPLKKMMLWWLESSYMHLIVSKLRLQ